MEPIPPKPPNRRQRREAGRVEKQVREAIERMGIQNPDIQPEATSTALKWLRSIGAGSILLGMVGLMQTFFWPSVIAVYFGLTLLFVDLFYEQFQNRVLRGIFLLLIVLVLFGFSDLVVLRKDPIGVSSVVVNSEVLINVINWNDVDLQNVDLIITLDRQFSIVKAKQVSGFEGVLLLPVMPGRFSGNQIIRGKTDPTRPGTVSWYGNFQRIRCDRLPRQSVLQVSLELREGDNLDTFKEPISTVAIEGIYTGKFRTFTTSQNTKPRMIP